MVVSLFRWDARITGETALQSDVYVLVEGDTLTEMFEPVRVRVHVHIYTRITYIHIHVDIRTYT